MATEVKKVKFVYFDYVHPKAFHLTSYKKNLFLTFASYIEKFPEITLKYTFSIICNYLFWAIADVQTIKKRKWYPKYTYTAINL